MTPKEVKKLLKSKSLKWSDFIKWMNGQTVGGTPNDPDYFEWDVERFINKLPTID